jgi:hypothetical protein
MDSRVASLMLVGGVLLNLVVGGGALLPFFFRGTKVQSEESAIGGGEVVRVVLLCVRCSVSVGKCSCWFNAFSFVEVERRLDACRTLSRPPEMNCFPTFVWTRGPLPTGDEVVASQLFGEIQLPNACAEPGD